MGIGKLESISSVETKLLWTAKRTWNYPSPNHYQTRGAN